MPAVSVILATLTIPSIRVRTGANREIEKKIELVLESKVPNF